MDTHPTPEILRDYRDGQLSADEGTCIEDHLDGCEPCAAGFGALLAEHPPGTFARQGGPPRPLAPPPDLEEVLIQLGAPAGRGSGPGTGLLPVLDNYEILEEVGHGAMGVVYRALDLAAQRIVAIKTIAARQFPSHEARQRFHSEAEALARLGASTDGVVQVFAHGNCRGLDFISMEYVAGGSLDGRLADLIRQPGDAARIVAEVAEAAGRLHHEGLIHRDIKPANILLQAPPGEAAAPTALERCIPLLTDFGLVKHVGDSGDTRTGEILGTPGFLAPEMIRSSKDATPAADIYSLGATLYACLTGAPPFKAATPFDTLKRVESDDPTSPARLNRASPLPLQWICLKCLEKNPARRYPRAADLAADLRRFLNGEAVEAGPPAWWMQTFRWIRANPRKVAVALGVGVVLLVLAGVALLWGAREAERRAAAEKLAESEQTAAHEARVAVARERARRGDWIRALRDYDAAIQDHRADALRLRVERLVGFFALNRTTDLIAELDALGSGELGDLAAQVKLIRGAWFLCSDRQQQAGRDLVREALETRQHLFSPADALFAEALVAERVGQTIRLLRRATEKDPLHYLATSTLAVALAAVGEREEALRHIRFLRGIFPFSPMPDCAEALLSLLECDRAALKKKLAALAGKLPPDRQPLIARMEEFLLLIIDLQEISERLGAGQGWSGFSELPRAMRLLSQAKKAGGLPNLEPLGLPVPIIGLVQRRFLDIFSAYLEVGPALKLGLAQPKVLPRLEALNEDYPDAGLLLLTAAVRLRLAVVPVNRGDLPNARKEIEIAAELSARAVQAPRLLPHSSVPYMARGLGAVADVSILKLVRRPDPVHLRRFRESLHLLVSEGHDWEKLRQRLIGLVIQMLTAPLTRQQCIDWGMDTPAGGKAFADRRRNLVALGGALLDDWALDEPNNPVLAQLRKDLATATAASGLVENRSPVPKK
jgi:Protein kinase domain